MYGLGEASFQDLSARLSNGHKYATLVEGVFYNEHTSKMKVIDAHYPRDTHDQVIIQGSLESDSETLGRCSHWDACQGWQVV